MSVSIFDENTPQDGLEFTPFKENKVLETITILSATLTGGLDTREIDSFRQGIELSSETYRFKGLGAKIWAGNIKGYTIIRTLGQALSFTEYKNDKRFNDLLVKFNPIAYIELGELYPYPLIFNEGPQQNKETSIQPFTIPFRNGRDTNEAQESSHDVRGSLEDGNQNVLKITGFTNRISQFIPYYNRSYEYSPFLDEGELLFGDSITGSIKIGGYVDSTEINIIPYSERGIYYFSDQLRLPGNSVTYGSSASYTPFVSGTYNTYTYDYFSSSTPIAGPLVWLPLSGNFYTATEHHDSGSSGFSTFISDTFNGNTISTYHFGAGNLGITVPPLVEPTYRTLTGSCTAAMWVRLPTTASWGNTNRMFFSIRSNGENERNNNLFALAYNATTREIIYNHETGDGTEYVASTSLDLSASTWIHFAAVRRYNTVMQTGSILFYQNGVLLKTVPVPDSPFPTSGSDPVYRPNQILNIGGGGGMETVNDSRFSGSMSSFKMFPRALNITEINTEYAGTPAAVSQSITSSNVETITAYYITSSNIETTVVNNFIQTYHSFSKANFDNDIRGNFDQKSATAGSDVYGPGQGRTGTDSITFNGWFRGN